MRFIPHILVLAVLAIAEIPRLQVFYDILVNNPVTSYMVAFVTMSIIFYLGYYKHIVLSIIATIVCISINIASFQPALEMKQDALAGEKLPLLEYPDFEKGKYWAGRDSYKKAYELEVSRIEKVNSERQEHNKLVENSQSPIHFWYLLATALVMSIFIPVLNFVVSHKIANLAVGSASLTNRKASLTNRESGSLAERSRSEEDDDEGSDEGFPYFPVRVNGDNPEPIIQPAFENMFEDVEDKPDNHPFAERSRSENDRKDTRNYEIAELYKSGKSAIEIGQMFNISRQRVYNILKSFGKNELMFG